MSFGDELLSSGCGYLEEKRKHKKFLARWIRRRDDEYETDHSLFIHQEP